MLELPPVPSTPGALLVVLHGDEGNPSVILPRWSAAARERGVALLALQCPRDEGCKGSWWQWSGDPSWLGKQVDAVAARWPVDRERVWLTGWSGGASYIGQVAPALRGFTGIVMVGGGLPPSSNDCPPCSPPVAFVAGNGNPYHHLAVASRDAFLRCGATVDWTLLPGKDHGGEFESLDRRRTGKLLDWLASHHACGPAALAAASASAATSVATPAPPAPSAPVAPPPLSSTSPLVAPVPHAPAACGCQVPGGRAGPGWGALVAVAILWRIRTMRSRPSGAERRPPPSPP